MSVIYKNEYESIDDEDVNIYSSSGGKLEAEPRDYYTMDTDTNFVKLGGILNFGYEITPNHKLFFRNFYNNTASDEVKYYTGYNDDQGNEIIDWRLMWMEEELYSGQLAGEHYFKELVNSRFDWRYNYGFADMDRPDLREMLYEYESTLDDFTWADESQSGFHMFTEQKEDIYDFALDWTIDFKVAEKTPVKVKGGYANLKRDRNFETRRFQFGPAPGTGNFIDLTQDPETLFSPENISPDGFEITEVTQNNDFYDATQRVVAGYGMGDVLFFDRLRLVAGARLENSDIDLESFNPFRPDVTVNPKLKDSDWMPSVNLNYNLTKDMNMRLGYSRTVSRPEFHELAPFTFYDERGGMGYKGNPNLDQSTIKNYDFRYEWFLGRGDLFAFSVFYKDIDDSIEVAVLQTIQFTKTWVNSDEAELYGFELELRKNLDFIAPWLRGFRIITNYTWADSEVSYAAGDDDAGEIDVGSDERELVGQPDNLLNVILEYNNPVHDFTMRLLYNFTDKRLNGVGSPKLTLADGSEVPAPDFFIESTQQLDFMFIKNFGKLGTKLVIENVTNHPYEELHGSKTYRKHRKGVSFKLGFSYTF